MDSLLGREGVEALKGELFFSSADFPLAVFPMPAQSGKRVLHTHDFLEIAVVRSGEGTHVTADREYPIGAGSVFVILPGQVHGYTSRELRLDNILCDIEKINLSLFDLARLPGYHSLFMIEPRLRDRSRSSDHLRLAPKQLAHVEALIEELKTELLEQTPGYQCMASSVLLNLMCYICRCYKESCDLPEWKIQQLSQLFTHLEENYAKPLSLAEMRKMANMSESSLRRTFHEIAGCSPSEYLIRLRVRKSCELLQHTNDLVTDIAYACGFHDSNYFTRQFRRVMETTPSAYRKRFQIVSRGQHRQVEFPPQKSLPTPRQISPA